MQTMLQKRARYALMEIQQASEKLNDRDRKEYLSYAASFPAMIRMNGLGQAAAFYLSKGGQHAALYELLSRWLTQTDQPYAGMQTLIEGITRNDMHAYRLAQAEALSLLHWVKKFAKAYLREDA